MVDEADRALAPDLSSAMEAMVRLESGLAHFGLGDLARARAELEATRQLVSNGGDFGALAFVLSGPAPLVILGVITHFEGDERGADALLAEALSMTDNALGMVLATFGNALLAAYRGDPAAASDHAKACVQIAADYPAYFAMGRMLDGWAAARQGDPEGVKGAEDAFAAYSVDGTLLWIPLFLVLRAEAHVCTGDPRGAQELVALARSVASRTGEDCLGPRLSALATEIERAAG